MQLRNAFAHALRLFRTRRGASQQDLAMGLDRSHISRLETGRHNPTLEASESLAESMHIQPLSLLIVAYAIKQGSTPRQVMEQVRAELESQELLDVTRGADVPTPPHPLRAKAAETNVAVQALKKAGLSRERTARELGAVSYTHLTLPTIYSV